MDTLILIVVDVLALALCIFLLYSSRKHNDAHLKEVEALNERLSRLLADNEKKSKMLEELEGEIKELKEEARQLEEMKRSLLVMTGNKNNTES